MDCFSRFHFLEYLSTPTKTFFPSTFHSEFSSQSCANINSGQSKKEIDDEDDDGRDDAGDNKSGCGNDSSGLLAIIDSGYRRFMRRKKRSHGTSVEFGSFDDDDDDDDDSGSSGSDGGKAPGPRYSRYDVSLGPRGRSRS